MKPGRYLARTPDYHGMRLHGVLVIEQLLYTGALCRWAGESARFKLKGEELQRMNLIPARF